MIQKLLPILMLLTSLSGCVSSAPHPHRAQLKDDYDRIVGYVNAQPIIASQVQFGSRPSLIDGRIEMVRGPDWDPDTEWIETSLRVIVFMELAHQAAVKATGEEEAVRLFAESRSAAIETYGGGDEGAADAAIQQRHLMTLDEWARYERDLVLMDNMLVRDMAGRYPVVTDFDVRAKYESDPTRYADNFEAARSGIHAELEELRMKLLFTELGRKLESEARITPMPQMVAGIVAYQRMLAAAEREAQER